MKFRVIISWFLILCLVLLFTSIVKNSVGMKAAYKRLAQAEEKVANLENQHNQLFSDVLKRSSEHYLEEQIRNKFNMVKPGEQLVILPPELNQIEEGEKFYYQSFEQEEIKVQPVWRDWLEVFL